MILRSERRSHPVALGVDHELSRQGSNGSPLAFDRAAASVPLAFSGLSG
jgi:hypothetical protein